MVESISRRGALRHLVTALSGAVLTPLAGCGRADLTVPEAFELPGIPGLTTSAGWPMPGLRTATFANRITLMCFWAPSCSPCADEYERLRRLAADRRFDVVGIVFDDGPSAVRDFLRQHGNAFSAISIDERAVLKKRLNLRTLPTKVLVGPDYTVAGVFDGPMVDPQIRDNILAAVKKLAA